MRIVVFSGAGISRESGLLTFRDSKDGLWNGHNVEEVTSVEGWRANPAKVLDFYNMRRREVLAAQPNAAHLAIAELEREHQVTVITQNVDDLHERAGSTRVIHLHGEVLKARGAGDDVGSDVIPWREDMGLGDLHPRTQEQLRPHIVWFGEGLPEFDAAMREVRRRDLDAMLVVGTSLNVFPAALIAIETNARNIYLVDPEPPEWEELNLRFIAEPATTGVPRAIKSMLGDMD